MPTVADTRHPEYPEAARRAAFALAHYQGELYEALPASGAERPRAGRENMKGQDAGAGRLHGLRAEPFLVRHEQGESDDAFLERRRISTGLPFYPFAVDGLAGQVVAAEDEAQRTWEGSPLGDPEAEGSIMSRVWENADGQGADWRTFWSNLAPKLVCAKWWGILVEGTGGDPRVRVVSPADVVDWHGTREDPEWVVIEESAYADREPGQDATPETVYLTITREGWVREKKVEGSTTLQVVDPFTPHSYRTAEGRPRCPFRFVRVAIDRDLGYQMAMEANALMNRKSTVDWRFWTACINRVHVDMGEDSTPIGEVLESIREHGQSVFVTRGGGSVAYVHPSQEPALAAWSVFKEQARDFLVTFFRSHADAAATQRTATEIQQQNDLGVEAYLVFLADALDEAERFALAMMEQAARPVQSAVGTPVPRRATVERANSFQPTAPEQLAEGIVGRYFGGPVPAGLETLTAAAERVHALDGLPSDPAATREAVRLSAGLRAEAVEAGAETDPAETL